MANVGGRREVLRRALVFSPNDLVFGHRVRGPLASLTGVS